MRTIFFPLAAAALAASLLPQAASAQTGDCAVASSRTNTTLAAQTTTSQTFVDVPGAVVDFPSLGPTTCAIVQVTVQVRAADPRIARLRVILVGDPAATIAPNPANLYTSQKGFDQRTIRFVLNNLSEGNHTLKVQFLSTDGSPVSLSKVITTVHFLDAT